MLNLPPANIPSKIPPCVGDRGLMDVKTSSDEYYDFYHGGQQTLSMEVSPSIEYEVCDGSNLTSTVQIPLNCLLTDDYFKNEKGFYRWSLIREAYHLGLISQDKVVSLYRNWRDTSEFFLMDGFDVWGDYRLSAYGKCSKRGNDVYKHRVNEKFKILDKLPSLNFSEIFPDNRTPMIFVTLTVDTKLYSLDQAWDNISNELHKFESSLRQQYGDFVKFRVWEAHKSGYPHSHIAYYFKRRMFITFPHKRKKDGVIVHRIPTKHKDKINSFWGMSNSRNGVDVQAVVSTSGAMSEIKKYVTKSIYNEKGDKTNAMLCLYRKQQYALSKDFVEVIWGDRSQGVKTDSLKNDSFSLLVKDTVHNCNNEYSEVCDFRYSGVMSEAEMYLCDGFGEPPPIFDDKDYNLFRLFGLMDEGISGSLENNYSGTVRLDDEGFRFVHGLKLLDDVRGSKISLLCGWFSLVDNIIVDRQDKNVIDEVIMCRQYI